MPLYKGGKEYEELVGRNNSRVRFIIGTIHCMTPFMEVCRIVRRGRTGKRKGKKSLAKDIRKYTPQLRRGLIVSILNNLIDARSEHFMVAYNRQYNHELFLRSGGR